MGMEKGRANEFDWEVELNVNFAFYVWLPGCMAISFTELADMEDK